MFPLKNLARKGLRCVPCNTKIETSTKHFAKGLYNLIKSSQSVKGLIRFPVKQDDL